uniref:Uncharacterized protein n=1 Tax=Meloidogyne enterolobii TaxID=390850 RepID=A0A6V7VY22_MELEN|nr:unnamed protein product [Meloidogyne enterolobii]
MRRFVGGTFWGFWAIFLIFSPKTSKYALKYALCRKVRNMQKNTLYANRNPL